MVLKKFLLLSILIVSSIPIKPANIDWEESLDTITKVGIFTTVAASCGYGIYKFGEWLFSKTDKELYQEAHDYYNKVNNTYKKLITTYSQEIYCPTIEQLLLRLPIDKTIKFECYFEQMELSLRTLADYNKQLATHIQELTWSKNTDILPVMKKLYRRIQGLIQSLKPIHKLLAKHKTYFIGKRLHKTITKKYEKLLHIYQQCYIQDKYRNKKLNELFTPFIDAYQRIAHYPFVYTVTNLKKDIHHVQDIIIKFDGYIILEKKLLSLIKNLKNIRALLKTNKHYLKERQDIFNQQTTNQCHHVMQRR